MKVRSPRIMSGPSDKMGTTSLTWTRRRLVFGSTLVASANAPSAARIQRRSSDDRLCNLFALYQFPVVLPDIQTPACCARVLQLTNSTSPGDTCTSSRELGVRVSLEPVVEIRV